MATGDRICPNCGQWQVWCKCGWAAARQRESWSDVAAPVTSGYVHRADIPPSPPGVLTTTAKPGDPTLWTYPDMLPQTWGVTTTTTRKPRKRRHFRQVVY
jgi:hypothetical protein